ncbi:transketolase family protein [Kitasatospora sp. CB02891]|uniref:transketolase family protein n=1 Tax=Kitasatospora sp. CB02891 TaxID=2020329 RepID=UPI000C27A595|nr:transketolase C-terminal domain-containing protein [Kitasatospora sp. CB02891]PJN30039.1 transketolase [Kitasatospora sp. CB02891]
MRQRFVDVTTELLDVHENLALVTADLTAGLFGAARESHPDRVLNLGIREQLLVSVAGGLSLAGMRPIAHSFAPFLVERPFEQIKVDLNHQDVGAVLVSAGASYDMASGGRSHQSPGDVALLSTLPHWTIHVPGHPDEAEAQLREAATGDGLVYVRLSNQSNAEPYGLRSGPGFRLLRRGRRATVIAVGPLADPVLQATEHLDVTVLYAATIRPFDAEGLRAAVHEQAVASVVLVEPYLAGTSTAEISDALIDRPHRILALGVAKEELRHYGSPRQHSIAHGLGPAGMRQRINSFLSP